MSALSCLILKQFVEIRKRRDAASSRLRLLKRKEQEERVKAWEKAKKKLRRD